MFLLICCHFSVHIFPSLNNFGYLENSFLQECHLNEALGGVLDDIFSSMNRTMIEDC